MIEIVMSMLRDEEAATLVEYGILIGFIAIVCIAAITLLGQNLSTIFNSVAGSI